MMNLLSAKQQSINNKMLQTNLQRDLEYALGKKPSLDGLSTISKTQVDGPFLGINNLKLDKDDIKVENIVKQNSFVNNQISKLENETLNSNNVTKVVEMKYKNNNGVENGFIKKTEVRVLPDKNNKVELNEEVINIPEEKKVVNSFIIDLSEKNDDLFKISPSWEINSPAPSMKNDNDKIEIEEEIYNGIVSVDNINIESEKNQDNSFEVSFHEMKKKMNTNKIIIILFIVIVIFIIFFLKK